MNKRFSNWKKQLQAFLAENVFLLVTLAICAPLYLANALKYSVPMGYAGLFTQMAQQIADANFQLPMASPFYGPGGIPFAYPPFGMYLLAIFIKVTGKYYVFLRLLPPLLGLISFIPLYFLTLELSKSRIAAVSTVIIAAGSTDIYIAHAWAAGIVRAPAFIFALTSIFFFSRQLNKRSIRNVIFTGVFFGLTCLSHLEYALFCFLWIWWWSIFSKNAFLRIKDALVSSGVGLLVASIWFVPILLRYGIDVFTNAFGSHGGQGLFSIWDNARGLVGLFLNHFKPISSNQLLLILVLLGVICFVMTKEFAVPLFYLFIILAFPDGSRFVFLIGSIVAGMGLSAVVNRVSVISPAHVRPIVILILLVPILGFLWWNGFVTFSRQSPNLYSAAFDLSKHIQSTILPHEKYLALVNQDEAEWMPFLFQREPVVAQWGSEWLGKYDEQTYLMGLFRDCQRSQDWLCVTSVAKDNEINMDYIITYIKDGKLNNSIMSTREWEEIFVNGRYKVWKKIN